VKQILKTKTTKKLDSFTYSSISTGGSKLIIPFLAPKEPIITVPMKYRNCTRSFPFMVNIFFSYSHKDEKCEMNWKSIFPFSSAIISLEPGIIEKLTQGPISYALSEHLKKSERRFKA
jgi:hypothetical protein